MHDELAAIPGTVSVWYGRPGATAAYALNDGATHYAASTMKVAVLAAAYRRAEVGQLDLANNVMIVNEFASAAAGAPAYRCQRSYDNDEVVWDRLGTGVALRWLMERMIVRSSNLATNIVLRQVGIRAADEIWQIVGAQSSVIGRGIEDAAAASAGITNLVTAADLAALFSCLALGAQSTAPPASTPPASTPPASVASPAGCQAMLRTLLAQECTEDLAAGLPPGTRVAHKNGWVDNLRHAVGVIFPDDAPPFVLAVCTTTPLARGEDGDDACQLVARIAAAAWADRQHEPLTK
jgi:beta-lactamase class A